MCGIVAYLSRDPIRLSALAAMTNALRHRGPDDYGFTVFGETIRDADLDHLDLQPTALSTNVALGHRRLTILDTSPRGRQPMSYSGRYHLVYNGEIYNYVELRAQLRKEGYQFCSNSDTEVILAAYQRWGTDCLSTFNGMWALVLYDAQLHRLFVARDRFAVKPLVHYQDDRSLLFSSEAKALVGIPLVRTAPNLAYCREYLRVGALEHLRETGFTGVFRFPPASYIDCHIDDLWGPELPTKRFWSLTPTDSNPRFDGRTAQRYAEEYLHHLQDAVQLRLRADVKVGTALSGGLDSGSIVHLIDGLMKARGVADDDHQQTFSAVFRTVPEALHCDESAFIERAVAPLCARSNRTEIPVDQVPEEYVRMIYAMDTPPASSHMSGWFTYKLVARTDVKVMLDGQGADEQLAGYLRYLPNYLAHLRSDVLREFVAAAAIPGAGVYRTLGLVSNAARRLNMEAGLNLLLRARGTQLQTTLPLNEVLARDVYRGLTGLLHYSDRTSMHFSIECRVPFMDVRLVEFLARVPAPYKIHNGWTKYIARLAMQGRLDPAITWRRDKMGFPCPNDYRFQGPLRDWFCSEISRSELVRDICPTFRVHEALVRGMPMDRLMRYLNLALWHRVFFEGEAPA